MAHSPSLGEPSPGRSSGGLRQQASAAGHTPRRERLADRKYAGLTPLVNMAHQSKGAP